MPETALSALGLASCDVFPRRSASEITHADQLRQLASPVLLDGAALRRANFTWSPESFDAAFGSDRVTLRDSFLFSHFGSTVGTRAGWSANWTRTADVRSFVKSWRSSAAEARLERPAMVFQDYALDRLHPYLSLPNWLSELGRQRRPDDFRFSHWPVLSLGGTGSGVSFHSHWEAWVMQLVGAKLWLLYPPHLVPDEPSYSRLILAPPHDWLHAVAELPPSARPLTCLQRAGELLWLPDFWMHATHNVGDSVAVGGQLELASTRDWRLLAAHYDAHYASYFVRSNLAAELVPVAWSGAVRSAKTREMFERAVERSPLHLNVRVRALRHLHEMPREGREQLGLALLRDGVASLEAQLAAGRLTRRITGRALALLSAAALDAGVGCGGGAPTDAPPTDAAPADAARVVADAILRACELEPNDGLWRAAHKRLAPRLLVDSRLLGASRLLGGLATEEGSAGSAPGIRDDASAVGGVEAANGDGDGDGDDDGDGDGDGGGDGRVEAEQCGGAPDDVR